MKLSCSARVSCAKKNEKNEGKKGKSVKLRHHSCVQQHYTLDPKKKKETKKTCATMPASMRTIRGL
jgi:tRNA(Phe) wybutosine-synthesizing methylase Tyw3